MNKILTKKILAVIVALLGTAVLAETNKGTFYKLSNSPTLKGMRGVALRIAVPNTAFNYEPATKKSGVLTELAMSAYAVSLDNTTLALAESMEQEDGNYLSRVVFMEFSRFKIINGIEFTTPAPIQKMFFFYDKLYLVIEGKTTQIQAVILGKTMKIYKKSLEIPDGVNSICCDKTFFYVKCRNRKLLQIDDALQINSTVEARHNGGIIFTRTNSNTVNNLTKENIETFRKDDGGIFKSNYYDLKDAADPNKVFLHPRDSRYIYFSTKDGDLYKITNSSFCEKIDISPFQDIFLHPRRHEFYLLTNKRNMLEIIRLHDMKVRRELNHYKLRPATDRFLKFMIPHNSGIFLISQRGEFMLIVERKRRFYKYKYLN